MYKKYLETLKFSDYKDHLPEINTLNHTAIDLLLLFYILISLLNLIGYSIASGFTTDTRQVLITSIYSVLVMLLYQTLLKNKKINFTIWIYIFEFPIYIYTILMGTFIDPHSVAFTFLLLSLVLPLFIMDRPTHILFHIFAYAFLFLICDYFAKPTDIFLTDALHTVNTTFFAIGANALTLYTRIRNIRISATLKNKSVTDPLTGVYNREGAVAHTNIQTPGLFLYIDLDNFKYVNDHFGHKEGDYVLIQFTQILRQHFRSQDIITRLGGDEFTVFSPGVWNKERAGKKCEELINATRNMTIDGQEDAGIVTLSIGAIISDGHFNDLEAMINTADAGMYFVKKHGKDNYHFLNI